MLPVYKSDAEGAKPETMPAADAMLALAAGAPGYGLVAGHAYKMARDVDGKTVLNSAPGEYAAHYLRQGYRLLDDDYQPPKPETSTLDKIGSGVASAASAVGESIKRQAAQAYEAAKGSARDIANVGAVASEKGLLEAGDEAASRVLEAGAGVAGLIPGYTAATTGLAGALLGSEEAAKYKARLEAAQATPTAQVAQMFAFHRMAGKLAAKVGAQAAAPQILALGEKMGLAQEARELLGLAGDAALKLSTPGIAGAVGGTAEKAALSGLGKVGLSATAEEGATLGQRALAAGVRGLGTTANLAGQGAAMGAEGQLSRELANETLPEPVKSLDESPDRPGLVGRVAAAVTSSAFDNVVGGHTVGATTGVIGKALAKAGKWATPLEGAEAARERETHAREVANKVKDIDVFEREANARTPEGEKLRFDLANESLARAEMSAERRAAVRAAAQLRQGFNESTAAWKARETAARKVEAGIAPDAKRPLKEARDEKVLAQRALKDLKQGISESTADFEARKADAVDAARAAQESVKTSLAGLSEESKAAVAARDRLLDDAITKIAAPEEHGTLAEHAKTVHEGLELALPAVRRIAEDGTRGLRRSFVAENVTDASPSTRALALHAKLLEHAADQRVVGQEYTGGDSDLSAMRRITSTAELHLKRLLGKNRALIEPRPVGENGEALMDSNLEVQRWAEARMAAQTALDALPPQDRQKFNEGLLLDVVQPWKRNTGNLIDWTGRQGAPPIVRFSKELYVDGPKEMLEDPEMWGERVATHLKKTNAATSLLLDAERDVLPRFTQPVMGKPVVDSRKVEGSVGTERAADANITQAHLDNLAKYGHEAARVLKEYHPDNSHVAKIADALERGSVLIARGREQAQVVHDRIGLQREMKRLRDEAPDRLMPHLRELAQDTPEMTQARTRLLAAQTALSEAKADVALARKRAAVPEDVATRHKESLSAAEKTLRAAEDKVRNVEVIKGWASKELVIPPEVLAEQKTHIDAAQAKIDVATAALEELKAQNARLVNARTQLGSVGHLLTRTLPGRLTGGAIGGVLMGLPFAATQMAAGQPPGLHTLAAPLIGAAMGVAGGLAKEAYFSPVRTMEFNASIEGLARAQHLHIGQATDNALRRWVAGFSPTVRAMRATEPGAKPYSELSPLGQARKSFGQSLERAGKKIADVSPHVISALTASQRDRYLGAVQKVTLAAQNIGMMPSAVASVLGNGVESAPGFTNDVAGRMSQVVQFLQTKLPPRREAVLGVEARADEGVSKDEADRFLRYFDAALFPDSVLDDLSRGEAPREGIEAMRAIYPEMYKELHDTVVDRVKALGKPLSHDAAVLIGTTFDIPTTVTIDPSFVQRMQGAYMSDDQPDPNDMGNGRGAPRGPAPGSTLASQSATPTQKMQA